jgi:mercuric ion binding protein
MSCVPDAYIVRQSIASIPGVDAVQVSYERKIAVISFDDAATTPEAMMAASASVGFPSRLTGNFTPLPKSNTGAAAPLGASPQVP